MMPEDRLSAPSVIARFVGAKALAVSKTIDYEDGGTAIQDASNGLLVQRWRARLIDAGKDSSHVLIDAATVPEFIALQLSGISEISFTFDQTMRLALAYVRNGRSYLRWYDSLSSSVVTTDLGSGVITPRVFLDDKRFIASDFNKTNDVILGYVRDGALCYRQQRDRYSVERVLVATGVNTGLIKIGMSRQLRVQFMLEVK